MSSNVNNWRIYSSHAFTPLVPFTKPIPAQHAPQEKNHLEKEALFTTIPPDV
ncbi:hypothetical protein ARMA_1786 [Ardenticatena maritima]|uniref:Uncharacterized protein n=1 Tax=Ardenticatena maritima TaxID=872965 RepID=A0A0M8K7G3_9CHLR|nr:hypothetical protein [Ardenticatena maritima]GAP63363.1 hypothetical protein ARMA_1786 [Ardenticatena maritima]